MQRAFRPVYRDVCKADALPSGTMRGMMVDGVNVLLVHVGDEYFAVRNACGESPLPLDYSTLDGFELRCSWHGCRYDVRTGHRLDRPDPAREDHLNVLPIRDAEGMLQVVLTTTRAAATGSTA